MTLFLATLYAGRLQQRLGRRDVLRVGIALHAIACAFFIGLAWTDSV